VVSSRVALALTLGVLGCSPGDDRYDFASGPDLGEASTGADTRASTADADTTSGASSSAEPDDASSGFADGSEGPGGSSSDGADDGPPGHGDPATDVPEFHALLEEIEGWATGTTGGLDGTIFVVDTLADAGDRSLRAALESAQAHWIVFADGLDGTIQLASTIRPGSDKTVDARGHDIRIRGGGSADPFTAMRIESQSNLVLVNLTFDDELENWDQDSEGADGLNITDSHHVWIHHCTFARWIDGAIDIRHGTGELPHHISVTWSRFSRVYQALAWTADRASFGHNVCERIRRRCIKIIDGKGHSWNNVISDWNAAAIQNAKDGAQLYSLRNMFVPGGVSAVNDRSNGGKIKNSNNHAFGTVQFVGSDDALDEEFEDDSKMLAIIDVCSDGDDGCWSDLRERIENEAGVQ
jgi:pectate lyase